MRCPSSVDLTSLIGNDGKDPREMFELVSLRRSEASGEAIDGKLISVEELGGVRGRRERMEDGGIPVMVR